MLWVAALLASLLALEFLFRDDAQDGTLEQYALSGQSLTCAAVRQDRGALAADRAAAGAHGAAGGAVARRAGRGGARASSRRVALGSVALSLIGSIGAALTLGMKRSGALLSLLTLPLALPVLIFGARATQLAISGGAARRAAGSAGGARGARRHAGAAGRRGRRAHQSGVGPRIRMTWTWFHRLGSPPYVYALAHAADALVRAGRRRC